MSSVVVNTNAISHEVCTLTLRVSVSFTESPLSHPGGPRTPQNQNVFAADYAIHEAFQTTGTSLRGTLECAPLPTTPGVAVAAPRREPHLPVTVGVSLTPVRSPAGEFHLHGLRLYSSQVGRAVPCRVRRGHGQYRRGLRVRRLRYPGTDFRGAWVGSLSWVWICLRRRTPNSGRPVILPSSSPAPL
ncbi:hypothetical protein BH24ACT20_BH24ACT20_10920 [soil metagenome]